MKRWILPLVFILALCGGRAMAQQRPARPTVSPYLNLLRRDSPPGVNYYNLVRPEFEFRSAIQQLQVGVRANQQTLTDLQGETLGPTGHAVGFQNHLGYFQNSGRARTAPSRSISARSIGTKTIPR